MVNLARVQSQSSNGAWAMGSTIKEDPGQYVEVRKGLKLIELTWSMGGSNWTELHGRQPWWVVGGWDVRGGRRMGCEVCFKRPTNHILDVSQNLFNHTMDG